MGVGATVINPQALIKQKRNLPFSGIQGCAVNSLCRERGDWDLTVLPRSCSRWFFPSMDVWGPPLSVPQRWLLPGEEGARAGGSSPRCQEQPSMLEKKSQRSRTTVVGFLLIQSLNGFGPTSGTGSVGEHGIAGPSPQGTPVLWVTECTHKPHPPS